jgi:hypothetical protein
MQRKVIKQTSLNNLTFRKSSILTEWVNDYCLTENENCFSYIMKRTSYNVTFYVRDDDDVRFVLDQHA